MPHDPPNNAAGRVFLVGAGPGDPGLFTLRGVECLRQADLVLYDYLVNPQILEHAPATAELVCLGRHGQGRIMSQAEVNQRLVREAADGKTVVRLKAGDPAVFARMAEEVEALTAAGIALEIVPGITAALAAGSHAGIPVTHRDLASAVALIAAHEQEDQHPPKLDYAALAAFPGTLVFYMGMTSASEWTPKLIAAGKPATTPTAIVRRCSWPDQATYRCTLATVAETIARHKLRPPAIVIVGDVVAAEASDSQLAETWFTSRPLFGKRVLVTRPIGQADTLRRSLQELGADVLVQPMIEIQPPADCGPVDKALQQLADYDWLVFSSSNGVRMLLDRLAEVGGDLRSLHGVRLAAIGPATAEELAAYRLRADLVPPEFRAESLADALAADARGKKFLLARASRGREVLAESLRAAGGTVEQVVVYRSTDVAAPQPEVADALQGGKIDWVTVTSSAIARSLGAMFGDSLRRVRLASISPVTSDTLRELGLTPAAEAQEYTAAGLVEAMLKAESRQS